MTGEGGPAGALGEAGAAGEGHAPVPMPPKLVLTEEQIGLLRREGEVRPVAVGEVLFREGDRGYDFIVILAGGWRSWITRPTPNGNWRPGMRGSSSLSLAC